MRNPDSYKSFTEEGSVLSIEQRMHVMRLERGVGGR